MLVRMISYMVIRGSGGGEDDGGGSGGGIFDSDFQ